jgi:GAF domain-containing protein
VLVANQPSTRLIVKPRVSLFRGDETPTLIDAGASCPNPNMAAEPNISPSSRRLGEYLECSNELIQAALSKQSSGQDGAAGKRFGELLLEDEAISLDALLAGIQAQRVDRLRACPLFTSLSDDDLAELSAVFQEVSATSEQSVITQNDRDPYLYILGAGRLEVLRSDEEGNEATLARVFPGEPVGEMGYFTNGFRSATVRALETVHLLRASYEDLTDCFEGNATVATAFMDVVTNRLRRTNLLYQENQYRHPATNRRLSHLVEFIEFPTPKALEQGVEALLRQFVHSISQLTDAERVTLYLIDPNSGDLWSRVGEGIGHRNIRISAGESIVGWVATHGELANVADAGEDERFDRRLDQRAGWRTHSVLCAPVFAHHDELIGVLEVVNKRTGIFDENDENLLRVFADQAAITAECSNLYRDVVRSHDRMAALLDVATIVTQTQDLTAVMKEIGAELNELLGCERSTLFAYDQDAKEMWSVIADSGETEHLRVHASSLVAGYSAITGEVVNIHDPYGDQRFNPEFDRQRDFRTLNVLCVPVVNRRGWVVGAVQADNKSEGVFNNEDEITLRAIASQLGVAIVLNT